MRFALLGFLLFSSVAVYAQKADCDETTPSELKPMIEVANAAQESACPNPGRMKGLCGMVSNRVKDSTGKATYMYQARMMEAACVLATDSAEEKKRKMRVAWTLYEDQLLCSGAQFDLTKGNILKWGVSYQFEDFIKEVIDLKVNLNRVDAADGRTLLDYIKYHWDRNKGNAMEMYYEDYYERFRKAGAKHKSEL